MVSVAEDGSTHKMPSFADIKSQALKAKDSAADKFSSTRDRFQVSTPSKPPISRFSRLDERSDNGYLGVEQLFQES